MVFWPRIRSLRLQPTRNISFGTQGNIRYGRCWSTFHYSRSMGELCNYSQIALEEWDECGWLSEGQSYSHYLTGKRWSLIQHLEGETNGEQLRKHLKILHWFLFECGDSAVQFPIYDHLLQRKTKHSVTIVQIFKFLIITSFNSRTFSRASRI